MIKKMIVIKFSFSLIFTLSVISCSKSKKEDSVISTLQKTDSIVKADRGSIPESNLSENIKKVIATKYLKPEDLKILDSKDRKFSYQEIDLNNDGKKEVFIDFFTPYLCGSGGCTLVLLDSDFNIINNFTVTETPLYISPNLKNGWNVIYVKSKEKWKALEYENGKYPSNPSVVKDSKTDPEPKSTLIFKNQDDLKIYNF